jgi:hypothetical protein
MTFGVYEEAPRVWGVGRIIADGELNPWRVSQADIDDEAESMAPRLAALGLADGGLMLIVSLLSEAIHVVPLEKAAGKLGALYSSADATPFDAFRTAALVRQLRPAIVLGVDGGLLDGLLERGDDLGVFASVPAVVARDGDTVDRLRAVGVTPRGWVKLGPTSALQGPDGDALLYDATRWDVDADRGELLVTNLVERLSPAERLRTGVRGEVLEPGRLAIPELSAR